MRAKTEKRRGDIMAPSQLVWQLVKNYNCFLHKGLNGSQFSAEPGNLYNLNSYKYSGGNIVTLFLTATK